MDLLQRQLQRVRSRQARAPGRGGRQAASSALQGAALTRQWVNRPALALLLAALLGLLAAGAGPAHAAQFRVLTWNLGWHLSQAQARDWIAACDAPFTLDPADRRWKPATTGGKPGWALPWRRDAPIDWDISRQPPCDVYRDNFKVVPVSTAAYARRALQMARVLARVDADVIAFQEVSGADAVREVLPDGGRDFDVCSPPSHSVQSLAFAWRKRLGASEAVCELREALSLPSRPVNERPRPGLSLSFVLEGKRITFLNVHLKSACFSPLESSGPDGPGQLAGSHPPCVTLQAQLEPLESWLQERSLQADHLVLLGDLNRHLGHEALRPADEPVRRPAGAASAPFAPGARSTNLWRELNDGDPPASTLTLLPAHCPMPLGLTALCEASAQRLLTREETKILAAREALGCRNPIGLDHIAISRGLKAQRQAEKVALGVFGDTRRASPPERPEPLLALSDHCPLTALIAW